MKIFTEEKTNLLFHSLKSNSFGFSLFILVAVLPVMLAISL